MKYKGKEVLDLALKDELRKKNGLSVIFVTKDKYPTLKEWQKYAQENQSEEDIKELYKKIRGHITGYSYFTGIGGLIDIDFDWEWTYHVALRYFSDRMDTRTIKTPNGGYRALFLVDEPMDFLDFKSKPPRVEIHGNIGHHVVVQGKALDDQNQLREYSLVNDSEIRKDNKIIQDFMELLTKINKKCYFLEYKCIAEKIKQKHNYLTQDQRTSIGSFFAAENIGIDTATDFFRMCDDFDPEKTGDHLERLYNKDFKHPTCEKLMENFNWNSKKCKGCKRKSTGKLETKKNVTNPEFDIRNLTISEIFNVNEINGKYYFPNSILATPIFVINNQVFYVTLLNTVPSENGFKKIIGIYGSKSGFGSEPLSFILDNDCAMPDAIIDDVNELKNSNQLSTLTKCIIKANKLSNNVQETPDGIFVETCNIKSGNIHEKLVSKLKYYIQLEDELQYYIIACWILGTYMFPLFSVYGYLIISGEKGAGKGTLLDLISKLCWNSTKKLIAPSESPLFRTIKEQMPTMIIDEYHRAIKNPGTGNAIESIIESGYEKEGVVPRTETVTLDDKTKKFEVVEYPVYCPKALVTRKNVEADDKAIKIILPKIFSDVKYAKRKKELINDLFFESAREFIMNWVILNQKEVLQAYNKIEPSYILNGREFNVWLPVLAISKIAFPDKFNEILYFIEESITKNQSNCFENEMVVLTALDMFYPNLEDGGKKLKKPSFKVTNRQIKSILESNGEKMHHQSIKSALENLKLVGSHKSGTYYIEQEKLEERLQERGFTNVNSSNRILSNEYMDDNALCTIYDLLLRYELNEAKFSKHYAAISNESSEKCSKICNILLNEKYIEKSSEEKLEPSDKFRKKVEQLMATKSNIQLKLNKNGVKSTL